MPKPRRWRLALMTLSALTGSYAARAASGPVVQTDKGAVQGFTKNNVDEFLGIPYAKPPVNQLRWKPPVAADAWTKTLMATSYGPTCAQITTLGVFAGPANNNEACLYLNVFTPKLGAGAKIPVLVWIHGGGNLDGESNDYDGSKLASLGDTVVVTINYRLNLMGFLAVPSLDAEGHPFGNYGILDQQFAMNWVRRNIAGFGGDPTNVTLGGQSAGAEDTGINMVSPAASKLFDRGICESGCPSFSFPTLASAETEGSAFATAAGCGGRSGAAQAQCLRRVPASQIEALAGTESGASPYVVGPMIDGTVLPMEPMTAFKSGQFTHMPLMNGNVQDEENFGLAITEYFSRPRTPPTAAQYQSAIAQTYGANAQKVLAVYPVKSFPSPQIAWDRAGTDGFLCGEQQLDQVLAPQIPLYAYEFDDTTAPFYFPKLPGFVPLAYHTDDIQFLFPLYHGGQGIAHPLHGSQVTLSNELVTAWTNFAATGNPNGTGGSPWPAYKPAANAYAFLLENVPALMTETNRQYSVDHHCAFWNAMSGQ